MRKTLLIALMALTTAISPTYAIQLLDFGGPTSWDPGTSIVISVYDGFDFGDLGASYGLNYWLEVDNSIDPFLSVTGLTFFTFPNGVYHGTFPVPVEAIAYGASFYPNRIPNGTYHVTDITLAIAANAPAGTYTLRTTTADPRVSYQTDQNFQNHAFPEATYVFTIVPEPSTLALFALTAVGVGVIAYRRRK